MARTLRSELREGATDGSVKKARPNTSVTLAGNNSAIAKDKAALNEQDGYGPFDECSWALPGVL